MACATELVDRLIERMGKKPLQILVEIQAMFNHVPNEAASRLFRRLDVPYHQILGDVEFYSFLSREPRGAYCLLLSDNITDWMRGSRELYSRLRENLAAEPDLAHVGKTSCTGMCDQGPAMLVNGMAVTNLSEFRIDAVSNLVKKKVPLSEWPEGFFKVESNIHRSGWLLEDASAMPLLQGEALLRELQACNLRGRGGAGFPTALKWVSCRDAEGDARYVVCNADEGEPGTFKDRVLLQHCAESLFQGMALCAEIVGAKKGFLYVRGEYRYLENHLAKKIEQWLPKFEIELHWGAGAYICGEESALIESIEGKMGIPRVRPPFPVTHGLFGMPTVVDNVETFCAVSRIACGGGSAFCSLGTETSKGTKLLSVSGDCARPGVYEYPFGVSVEEILRDCGAGNPLAVQVGGAAGACIGASEFGRRIGFEDLPTSGSVMVFDDTRSMKEVALNFSRFFAHESCGFCTPCRVGTALAEETVERIAEGKGTMEDVSQIEDLGSLMKASHCGLGQSATRAVRDMLKKFPEHFEPLGLNPVFLDGRLP